MTKLTKSDGYPELRRKVEENLLMGQRRIEQAKVRTYWQTGIIIDQHILKHADRADYGSEVIRRLSEDLHVSDTVLHRCVKFVQKYPDLRKVAARPLMKWTHYRKLITIGNTAERLRLEKIAAQKGWTTDELSARVNHQEPENKAGDDSTKASSGVEISREALTPLRGIPFTYRLIERPNVAAPSEAGLLLDLGFCVFRNVEAKLISQFKAGDIVSSYPKDDAYKFSSDGRTAKDLFTYSAFVEKVIDGDTLKVRMDLGFRMWLRETLRLRDIDCPEVGTPEGDEAKAFVQSHIKEADRITIWSSRSEKYDRYLADVYYMEQDKEIYLNQQLLDEGLARPWSS